MKQEITTSGGTYVVTFTQAGTVEADRNNRTYILATSSGAGQVAFKAISDSVIISDDNAILTAEDFVFAPGPILKPSSGGDSGALAIMSLSEDGKTLTYNLTDDYTQVPSYSVPHGVKRITGSLGAAKNAAAAFRDSSIAICDISLAEIENLANAFYMCPNLTQIDSDFPKVKNLNSAFFGTRITEWKKDFPNANTMSNAFSSSALTKWKSHCPQAVSINSVFGYCLLGDFDIDFPSVNTFNFIYSSYATLGVPEYLTNVTVPQGGLSSCKSFLLGNRHTALTDASIQNIVDGLPDYSGSGTNAVAQFPAGRLTPDQQATLTQKGWTWSEATD